MEINRPIPTSPIVAQPLKAEKPIHHDTRVGKIEQPSTNQEKNINDVLKKIDGMNDFLKSANTSLKFNLHEELNEYYITIVDENTNEVVKEVPPKKLLDIYAAMKETIGLFIDKKI